MIPSLRTLMPFALLVVLSACTTFRPIPSTTAVPGEFVRLQSETPFALSVTDEGGATRECPVLEVRGLLRDRADDRVRLIRYRVMAAPATTPRECGRGQHAEVRLAPSDRMHVAQRGASLKRTLGLGLGIYLGFGLLIAAFLVPTA